MTSTFVTTDESNKKRITFVDSVHIYRFSNQGPSSVYIESTLPGSEASAKFGPGQSIHMEGGNFVGYLDEGQSTAVVTYELVR